MNKTNVLMEYDLALEGLAMQKAELTNFKDDMGEIDKLDKLQDLILGARCTYESLYDNENDLLTIMLNMIKDAEERKKKK